MLLLHELLMENFSHKTNAVQSEVEQKNTYKWILFTIYY